MNADDMRVRAKAALARSLPKPANSAPLQGETVFADVDMRGGQFLPISKFETKTPGVFTISLRVFDNGWPIPHAGFRLRPSVLPGIALALCDLMDHFDQPAHRAGGNHAPATDPRGDDTVGTPRQP